jgi:CubicO group peptidase (beta-lactamase class C family)
MNKFAFFSEKWYTNPKEEKRSLPVKQLDEKIRAYCEKEKIMGVLRITKGEEICYDERIGFAHCEEKTPFTDDSVFTFYSMSKPFCAMGILQLVDQGLVDLDAHPGNCLPEAAGFDPRVTIRQLLQHTSGVPDFAPDTGYLTSCGDVRGDLQKLAAFPSHFEPGTGDRYSNIGYYISALIIENITGLSYPEYMEKQVFAPLGIHAQVDHPGLEIPNRVQGYRLDGNEQVVPCEKSHDWMLGGGDLIGTVEDVYALNRAIKHRLLLKPETWEAALTPSPINQKGFGCTVTTWHGIYEEEAAKRGIRVIWVPHALLDPRKASRQNMRDCVNRYMHTVLGEEPLDPSLEVFDDDNAW